MGEAVPLRLVSFWKEVPLHCILCYSYLSVLSSCFSSAWVSRTLLPLLLCLSSYLASVTFEPRLKILVLLSKGIHFLSFAGMNGLSLGLGGLRRARLTFPPFSGSRTLYVDIQAPRLGSLHHHLANSSGKST